MKALFFRAYYCGACNQIWDDVMEPLVDEGFQIEEIDAMKRPMLAERYRVKHIPTTVIVQGNTPVASFRGRVDQDKLRELLGGNNEL